jgi:hypothetical protein
MIIRVQIHEAIIRDLLTAIQEVIQTQSLFNLNQDLLTVIQEVIQQLNLHQEVTPQHEVSLQTHLQEVIVRHQVLVEEIVVVVDLAVVVVDN